MIMFSTADMGPWYQRYLAQQVSQALCAQAGYMVSAYLANSRILGFMSFYSRWRLSLYMSDLKIGPIDCVLKNRRVFKLPNLSLGYACN